jgi:hypothetical protein
MDTVVERPGALDVHKAQVCQQATMIECLTAPSAFCLEQNDEWLVGRRYLSAAAIARRSPSSRQPEQLPLTDERGRQLLHHVPGLDWE